jgi:hypothetical protein
MTYDELMATIFLSSRSDWLHSAALGIFTFKNDLNVRIIKLRRDEESEFDKCNEPWATKHPDKKAIRVFYDLYYGASYIQRFMLVSVDGHRAILPPPAPGGRVVPKDQYDFARIVDVEGMLDEYMMRVGFVVR